MIHNIPWRNTGGSIKFCTIFLTCLGFWFIFQNIMYVIHGENLSLISRFIHAVGAVIYLVGGCFFTFWWWSAPILIGILPYFLAHLLLLCYAYIYRLLGHNGVLTVGYELFSTGFLIVAVGSILFSAWCLARKTTVVSGSLRGYVVQVFLTGFSVIAFLYNYAFRGTVTWSLAIGLILISCVAVWSITLCGRLFKEEKNGEYGVKS